MKISIHNIFNFMNDHKETSHFTGGELGKKFSILYFGKYCIFPPYIISGCVSHTLVVLSYKFMHPQGFLLVTVGQWKVRCWYVLQSITFTLSAMNISQLVRKWKCLKNIHTHHFKTYKSHSDCLALQVHAPAVVLLSDHRTLKSMTLRCPPIRNIRTKCNGIN